ncbi:SDR family oxidoreductase [Ramlibacter sp.]|uniref:SDR family oxidoreductase n=1 Tax=Ramlibacter sp. TaxID=1917967 RepID=UPI002D4A7445|nr:SDR family oxidoreductase [Ramlibacter sp.]HYD75456.1 SDR family oxidoreductase [Ramlibacter sp.]
MTHRSFAGRTVVVTGAAGGLGRSLCLHFGAAGARVAALDRDADGLQALAAEMSARGQTVLPQPCDVTDAAACATALRMASETLGRIEVLVNNAGIAHRSAFAQTRAEVIRRVMEVNFFGTVHCTQAALPDLRAARGLVIAISSVAGFSPLVGRTGYAASKHALHGFFDSLRAELAGDGVEVLLVCPSFIATGIDGAALGGDGRPAGRPRQTTGAQATPDEVAQAIVRAASRGRRLLLPGATARTAWVLSRCCPSLYAALMRRRLQAELAPTSQGD